MVDETDPEAPEQRAIAAGSIIADEDIVSKFNTALRNVAINATVWFKDAPQYSQGDYFPTQLLDWRDKGGPALSELTPVITAQAIATSLGNWTKLYTATRNLHWQRTYVRNPYDTNYLNADITSLASLLPSITQVGSMQYLSAVTGSYVNGKYFTIYDSGGMVAVYYAVGTITRPTVPGAYRYIAVQVAAGDGYGGVPSITASVLNSDPAFEATWGGPIYSYGAPNPAAGHYCYLDVVTTAPNININMGIGTMAANAGWAWAKNITQAPYNQTSTYGASINNEATLNGITAGSMARAANFTTYVDRLYAIWNTAKNNTVLYSTYYCHTNCHQACSPRQRR